MKTRQIGRAAKQLNPHTLGRGGLVKDLIDPTTCHEVALERAREQIRRLIEQKQQVQNAVFAKAKRDLLTREKADQERFSIALARAVWRFSCSSSTNERVIEKNIEVFRSVWKRVMGRDTMTRVVLRHGFPGCFTEATIREAVRGQDARFYAFMVFWAAETCDWNEAADWVSGELISEERPRRLSRRTHQIWARRQTGVDAPTEIAARDWGTDVLRVDVELLFSSADEALAHEDSTLRGREDESYQIPRLRTERLLSSEVDRVFLTDDALTLLACIARDDPTGAEALERYVVWSEEMRVRMRKREDIRSFQSRVLATGT